MRGTGLLVAAIGTLWAGVACAVPKVAVVYSSWGDYAFREEHDSHLRKLGWDFEKFENKDVGALIPRLAEFDIVLSAGVGNYEHSVDMAPHRDAWLQFLGRGGLLLITDASYGSVLDLWTNRLGERFTLSTQTCARHTRVGADPDRQDLHPSDALLYAPHDLAARLAERTNLWAHIVPMATQWRSLATCADNQSLFVYQDVGPGCVLVTSHYSFKGTAHEAAATALLENAWTHVQGLRAGIALATFELGPALPGGHEAVLAFRNSLDAEARYEVRLALTEGEQGQAAPIAKAAVLAPGATTDVHLPYTLSQRGPVQFTLSIVTPGKPALVLSRQQLVPPLVALQVPNRHAYPWQAGLDWSGALAPEAEVTLADLIAELRLDGKPVAVFAAPAARLAGQADLAGLAVGEHVLELRLQRGDALLGAASMSFATHATPRIQIRPTDLTALVDGKPFFPMGFYHVSWSFSAEDRLQFLREVAAGGFNTVHASLKQMDEWDAFLAEAEKLGMKVITEFGVDMTTAITRYRGRKAVLAWNPGDEPDGGGVPPEVMLERHNRIKDADPEVPTYMTLCVPAAYHKYARMAEVIAPDPYPIHHATASTVPVFTMIRQAVAIATPLGRPIWAIPQAFGYAREKNSWRVPTFAEERNMTYLALLAGAKGLIYYTYRDTGFDMREHPELWEGMQSLPAEIATLEPFLLAGQRALLETSREDLFAGHWSANGRHVLCLVNTAATEAREVSLALPAGVRGAATDLFAAYPAGLGVQGDRLVGILGPLAVAVCEVR
jgi:hypothetical protein